MAREDERLGAYRRFLMIFALVGGGISIAAGATLLARGRVFYAFLALCVLGFLVLVARGYAAEERERRGR